jgi:hypothetical protein
MGDRHSHYCLDLPVHRPRSLWKYHISHSERKPALLDNLSQTLSAPLFVVVEIFEMLGIRSAEMQQWKAQIEKNVQEFRKKDRAEWLHKNIQKSWIPV